MRADTIVPKSRETAQPPSATASDRFFRSAVERALKQLDHGQIILRDGAAERVFGQRAADAAALRVNVMHPRFYRRVALGGSLGAGAAYIDGDWMCDNLTGLVQLLIRNESAFDAMNRGWAKLLQPLARWYHNRRENTLAGSRRNIAAHYDLSNDFYKLFLDDTLTYSCGIFETPTTSLRDASREKIDRLCRKLDLQPSDHLLEIGTGWGAFAIHAAQHYGCRVTTTTLSAQQFALAKERIEQAGLTDRITLLQQDYRELTGQFDKLVSVEMIEAVGWQYYDRFFEQCARLLKPDGRMALQAITVADRYYEHAKRDVDFIKRYVFPGSCLPSLSTIAESTRRRTDLTIRHLEDIGPHYATTLRTWRERFFDRLADVKALGYSDAFVRLWEFYLCYCEAGFRERSISTAQIILDKPQCRLQTLPNTG